MPVPDFKIFQRDIYTVFNRDVCNYSVNDEYGVSAVKVHVVNFAEIKRNGVQMRRFVGRKFFVADRICDIKHMLFAFFTVNVINAFFKDYGLFSFCGFQP